LIFNYGPVFLHQALFIVSHDLLRTFMLTKKSKHMSFIKVTSIVDSKPIFISVNHIGHIYQVPAKKEYSREVKGAYTKIGVETHNNGGFEVVEDVNQIMKLIEKAK